MTGQAGHNQPAGQANRPTGRGSSGSLRILSCSWAVLAFCLLALPFNRGGLWDPQEFRLAELGRRLSHQLFGSDAAIFAHEAFAAVTKGQIGQGELSATSPAIGFALFGAADWAGRLGSLAWGAVSILCIWAIVGRIAGRIAQIVSVLCLVSLPLFAWQSRSILGDAATIGTLALSTTGLLFSLLHQLEFAEQRSWLRASGYWITAIVGLAAGILCRGILIGVCVPALSVGLVGLPELYRTRGWRLSSLLPAVTLVGLGLVAGVVGVRELVVAKPGFSFWQGATLSTVSLASPFSAALTNLLHQAFPLSAFLPVAVVLVLNPSATADAREIRARVGAKVLVFNLSLGLVGCTLFLTRGVSLAFPAVVAGAAICGVAAEQLHRRRDQSLVIVAVTVLTVAVLLFADFVNLPETVVQMTGMRGMRLAEGFDAASQRWIGVATAVLGFGCLVASMSGSTRSLFVGSAATRYGELFERFRTAFAGQLLSGFVLLETALGTTGLLQRAHDRGWISLPAFDPIRTMAGSLLLWAWLVPPVLLFVVPVGYTTLKVAVDWLLMPGWGASRFGCGRIGQRGAKWSERPSATGTAQLSGGLVLVFALIASGLVLTLGHAPAMAERVSPKLSMKQYRAHARSDEPLALLGLKAESVRYYLGNAPEPFGDIEEAARWLEQDQEKRRWLALATDRFAELNAAFRAVSKGRNLALVEPLAGNTLLATGRLVAGESEYNPLAGDVLCEAPKTAHRADAEFGHVLRLVGWDVSSAAGRSAALLTAGEPYDLALVFEVVGTTAIDWQVFVHIDGRGRRHNGDHDPVHGRYPTTLWQPSDIVVDHHKIELERGALPGVHVLYMGLFRGNKRLEVTAGSHEDNRVRLGELQVQ